MRKYRVSILPLTAGLRTQVSSMKIFMVETGYMDNVAKVCGHHYARCSGTPQRAPTQE